MTYRPWMSAYQAHPPPAPHNNFCIHVLVAWGAGSLTCYYAAPLAWAEPRFVAGRRRGPSGRSSVANSSRRVSVTLDADLADRLFKVSFLPSSSALALCVFVTARGCIPLRCCMAKLIMAAFSANDFCACCCCWSTGAGIASGLLTTGTGTGEAFSAAFVASETCSATAEEVSTSSCLLDAHPPPRRRMSSRIP